MEENKTLAAPGKASLPGNRELVPVDKRLLAVDDPGSRWFVSPEMRNVWITAGSAITAVTGIIGSALQTGIAGAFFAVPVAVGAFFRGLHYRTPLPRQYPFPRAGEEGPPVCTTILQRIYDEIAPPHEARLRLTLFVPDPASMMLLRQFGRYSTHDRNVSTATVRMGTGDVGRAFTSCQTFHIPDVGKAGGFDNAMRELGVEEIEVSTHQQRDRKSFYSIPIIDAENNIRYGVLSLDAKPPGFFNNCRSKIRKGVNRSNLMSLMGMIRGANFPGIRVPDGTTIVVEMKNRTDRSAPNHNRRAR